MLRTLLLLFGIYDDYKAQIWQGLDRGDVGMAELLQEGDDYKDRVAEGP